MNPLNSQINECGTPDVPEAEYLNFLNSISPNVVIPTSGIVQEIPIHLTYVLYDDGVPFDHNFDFEAGIIAANEVFAGAMMSFYICDVSVISSTEFTTYDIPNNDGIGLFNLFHVEDAINVYQVDYITGASGIATLPQLTAGIGWVAMANGDPYFPIDPYVFAHELGHYFSLSHTFHSSSTQYVNYPIVNPAINGGTPSVEVSPGIFKACDNLGDFICDTPADPGNCWETNCNSPNNCPNLDAVGDTYNPNRENVMSYSHVWVNCDDEHFTPDQLTRVYTTLMNATNRNHLFNSTTSCPDLTLLLPESGNLKRYCSLDGDPPLEGQKLIISNITEGQSCESTITDELGNYNIPLCGVGINWGEDIDFTVGPKLYDPDLSYHSDHPGVTALDLALISQYILGIDNTLDTPYKLIAADANGSGSITALDQARIRQVIIGLTTTFPIGGEGASWRFFPTYYLNSSPSFNAAFFSNPFTAVWQNLMGTTLSYTQYMDLLQGNLQNSYFLDNDNWSFRAIKIGDVNCSAVSSDGMLTPLVSTELSSREEGLKIDPKEINGCLKKGERGEILFKLSSVEALIAYEMGLRLNNDKLKVIDLKKGNHGNFDSDNFNQDDLFLGDVKTIWWSKTGKVNQFVGDKTIFSVEIEVLEDICNLSDLIQPDNEILNNNFFNLEGDNVTTTLSFELKSDQIMEDFGNKRLKVNVFPNPSTDQFTFEFNVENAIETTITIYDRFGNSISQQLSLGKGKQNYTFNNISKLANGLLYYSISTEDNSTNGKLIKVE